MSDELQRTIQSITRPLLRILPQGDSVLILVTHPEELPPKAVLEGVQREVEAAGHTYIQNRLDWFSPNLVQFMRIHPQRVFSVLCPPGSVAGRHPEILNLGRSQWLEHKKGLILWVSTEAMPRLSRYASNFLDFYSNVIHLESGEPAPILPPSSPESAPGERIDISRLPHSGTPLIGRKAVLEALDRYLTYPEPSVVAFDAPGGVGKSALIEGWLAGLAPHYFGARKVFAWSFYSQGSHGTQTSSAFFFQRALIWFGFQGEIPTSDDEKAVELVKLLQQEKTILILDGVEPLQHDPTTIDAARFSDPGLHRLLRILSREGQKGLTIVTSRKPLLGMGGSFNSFHLEHLTNDESRELLTHLGVVGPLDEIINKMQGHALGLTLLGRLLKNHYQGDITRLDQITGLFAPTQANGDHARRIMAHYDEVIWEAGAPERMFLRFLGLFDRPMEAGPLGALLENLPFPCQPGTLPFNRMIQNLEEAGLLLPGLSEKNKWDAHPLVRATFGERWTDPESCQHAHSFLLVYFINFPDKHQPDTLEEMEPLYRAVHHGCRAGEYQKAFSDILWDRIWRHNDYFSTNQLGAIGSDLSALAGFFPNGWDQPVTQDLSDDDQTFLLGHAAYCLMSLGRLEEAIPLYQAFLRYCEKEKDWINAAIISRNLSDILLPMGKLQEAKHFAQQSLQWADQAENLSRQSNSLSTIASIYHQLGELKRSAEQFQEAEKRQRENNHHPQSQAKD